MLVLLSPGFEEIEAVTAIDILRRAGVNVSVAGLEPDFVHGSHRIVIKCDLFFDEINIGDYDCLLLPGGQPGTNNMKSNTAVLEIVRAFQSRKKWIAAICAAPTVLYEAGILANKQVTSYPAEQPVFEQARYRSDNIVIDDNIITSRGVGTAIDFALKMVEILKGKEQRDQLAEKILWK